MSTTPMEPFPEPINVAETLAEIRRRVAARLARTVPEIPELAVPSLEPLRQARAVAEGWAGAMGALNPRPRGLVNAVLQGIKRLMARSLRWFAFPQTQFNSGVVAALIRMEELFADVNRNLVVLGQNIAGRGLNGGRPERRRQAAEAAYPGQIPAPAGQMEQLAGGLEQSVRESIQQVRNDVSRVQKEYWSDFARYRQEMETRLEGELRLVRQRLRTLTAEPAGSPGQLPPALAAPGASAPATPGPEPSAEATPPGSSAALPGLDYFHFEVRFRGAEEDVHKRQAFYLPLLKGHEPVLDVACGRGEMLEMLRSKGIAARGVDLDADMVECCRGKNLEVERAEALAYLDAQKDSSLGAVFSAQFIEHLPARVYLKLIERAYAKLRHGGLLILETQNPECLAIYSQSFFLDPTHERPVPAAQLKFLVSAAGFTDVQAHYLSPLGERLPQLPLWPVSRKGEGPREEVDELGLTGAERWNLAAMRFNEVYFGHMDYALVAVKP